MSIVVKVAKTAQELQDAYRLRYQVYHGNGGFEANGSGMICDHFDSIPCSRCVVAYANGEAIGTMRVTCDSSIGLPADANFDFTDYRNKVECEAQSKNITPLFINAGMLAIAPNWRGRRDVFKAIFKIGCDVAKSWGCTHIISTVNEGTTTIYRRLGFDILGEGFFYPPANENVVPVASDLKNVFDWAFTEVVDSGGLMAVFAGEFEYLMVSAGERIFNEGEPGNTAYLINHGVVNISSEKFGTPTLSLASLGAGELFGEMSLIDGGYRSANATAVGNCELLVLNNDVFWQRAQKDANNMRALLRLLSDRVRSSGTMAHLYAHGDLHQRLEYFVTKVRQSAIPSTREPSCYIAKMTIAELACLACASIEQTERFMQKLVELQMAAISVKTIKFYGKADLSQLAVDF